MKRNNHRKGNAMKPQEKTKQTVTAKDVATVKATDLQPPKQEAAPAAPPAPTPAEQAAKTVMMIKVIKKDAKLRGAREAWYNRLKEFDGKPLDDFLASVKEKCPQLTKNGSAEPPMGWIGWFKRQGIAQINAQA